MSTTDIDTWLGGVITSPENNGAPISVSAAFMRKHLRDALLAPSNHSSDPLKLGVPYPISQARALMNAISSELDELRANAVAARCGATSAYEAQLLRLASLQDASARDILAAELAALYAELMSQVDSFERVKVAELEKELVEADAALEALCADCALVNGAMTLWSDDQLESRLQPLQARLCELRSRTAALPIGPTADSVLVFIPSDLPPECPTGGASQPADAAPRQLGSILASSITASDVTVTPLWLKPVSEPVSEGGSAPSSSPAISGCFEVSLLQIDLSHKVFATLGSTAALMSIERIVARRLIDVDALLVGHTARTISGDDSTAVTPIPTGADLPTPLPVRLEFDGKTPRITVLATLPSVLDSSSCVEIRRLGIRGSAIESATLPLHIYSVTPLSPSLCIDDASGNHFQQPCVTRSGVSYIPLDNRLRIVAADGITTTCVDYSQLDCNYIRACAYDDDAKTLFLGTNDSERSAVVALVSSV